MDWVPEENGEKTCFFLSGLTMVLSSQGRVTKPYCVEIESDMKHQHHTHHTRMAPQSVTGEPFLTWLDVCSWRAS